MEASALAKWIAVHLRNVSAEQIDLDRLWAAIEELRPYLDHRVRAKTTPYEVIHARFARDGSIQASYLELGERYDLHRDRIRQLAHKARSLLVFPRHRKIWLD